MSPFSDRGQRLFLFVALVRLVRLNQSPQLSGVGVGQIPIPITGPALVANVVGD